MGQYLTLCTWQPESDSPGVVRSPKRSKKDVPPPYPVFSSKHINNKTLKQDSTLKKTDQRSPTGSRRTSTSFSMESTIEDFFQKYKDKDEDVILAEGIEHFCEDLRVDPTEFVVLVLAWKFGADEMCTFTHREFVDGCNKLQAYSSETLRDSFPQLLRDADREFKDLYRFTFNFGLDKRAGQRSLPLSMAIALWRLVFTPCIPQILEQWCQFLELNKIRGISRDTWNMFLPFSRTISSDVSGHDKEGAWPCLFDNFVDYLISQK